MVRPILTLKKPPSPELDKNVILRTSPDNIGVGVEFEPLVEKSTTKIPAEIPPVLKLLCKEFPQTFNLKMRKPLKIGIYEDLLTTLENHPDVTVEGLKTAIICYTRNFKYLVGLIKQPHRIDLKGEISGEVEDYVKNNAAKRAEIAKRKRSEKLQPSPQTHKNM